MADAKITDLAALTTPDVADLLVIIDDVTGTPTTKKITIGDLLRGGPFIIPAVLYAAQDADSSLAAASGVQSAFDDGNDTLTVETGTYFFDGQYLINTGATTHTTASAFALAGGATVASFEYTTILWSAAANTISTGQSTTHVTGVASKVLNATSTAVWTTIQFQGQAQFSAGGTITPQINFSANPTGTNLMKRGSYIRFVKAGAVASDFKGPWS